MWSLVVVEFKPLVQVFLHIIQAGVEFFQQDTAEEFFQQGSVETFDEAISSGGCDFSSAVFDAVQDQHQLKGMFDLFSAVFAAVVGKDMLDFQGLFLVEGEDPVVQDMSGGDGGFGGVKVSEGETVVGIDHRLQIDASDSFEITHEKGVLGKEITRRAAFNMPLF